MDAALEAVAEGKPPRALATNSAHMSPPPLLLPPTAASLLLAASPSQAPASLAVPHPLASAASDLLSAAALSAATADAPALVAVLAAAASSRLRCFSKAAACNAYRGVLFLVLHFGWKLFDRSFEQGHQGNLQWQRSPDGKSHWCTTSRSNWKCHSTTLQCQQPARAQKKGLHSSMSNTSHTASQALHNAINPHQCG